LGIANKVAIYTFWIMAHPKAIRQLARHADDST
jgi:hypothetical protein